MKKAKAKATALARHIGMSRHFHFAQESFAKLSGFSIISLRAKHAAKGNGGLGNAQELLEILLKYEARGTTAPLSCGEWMADKLNHADGRTSLAALAGKLQAGAPNSILLLYLRCLGHIEQNEFEAAQKLASEALCNHCDDLKQSHASNAVKRKRAVSLGSVWKMIDAAARDQMKWANAGSSSIVLKQSDNGLGSQSNQPTGYIDLPHVKAFEKLDRYSLVTDYQTTLIFAEPLLQGKQNEAWLKSCELAYERSTTLFQRMRVIRSMWRQGFRRIPDYRNAYVMAERYFKKLQPELQHIREDMAQDKADPYAYARLFRTALSIARQLSLVDQARELRNDLIALAHSRHGNKVVWIVVNALSNDQDMHETTLQLIGDKRPVATKDLHDFFQWATRFGEKKMAHSVFDALPKSLQSHPLSLPYINILQRGGQFEKAEQIARSVYASILQTPGALDAERSQSLIRRIGELKFAAETARHFLAVPQPENPIGVIFATPRNIEQLRRSPLTVFLEWKKMGWAVIPLFEGVLPVHRTGIEKIDRYAACVEQNARFSDKTKTWLNVDEGCTVDLDTGKLAWRDIDLSHALWEEATISRRCYEPTWTCPALQRSLGNLVKWTNLLATVLVNARSDFEDMGPRAGIHSFFNFRLPDALTRFYCSQHGDPQAFFCIHASNSYENYFTNFRTNLSSLLSVRNMTSTPKTRAAPFPTAEMVAARMKVQTADEISKARSIVNIKRSTGEHSALKPEAEETRKRILEWRKKGGKTACAFGKVICDTAVPYDGGPAHKNLKDWINDTIDAVAGSETLLLIKPHPHELREEISCFLNCNFFDLIEKPLPDNVMFLGHDWFDINDLEGLIDLALIYSSTTSIEMALMKIPTIVASHFAPIDYPVGHKVVTSREQYKAVVQFKKRIRPAKDGVERATAWLALMRSKEIAVPYRYHSRQITNCVVYPPWWMEQDIEAYLQNGDENVALLARRGVANLPPHKDNGKKKSTA